MTPHDFIAKWRHGGDERRDAQPFFEDLCRLIKHPTPREADPEHKWFTYEYGATKASGGEGWADVWKKDYFGWEAKGTHKNLDKAYQQLKMYADALQNPPLLVVSDLHTIIVHTNFTNSIKTEYRFTIEDLADHKTRDILHAVFFNTDLLRPGKTRQAITEEAARQFATLAERLRGRKHPPAEVAHFLNRLLFCMFAEDIGLLPDDLFTKMVKASKGKPDLFDKRARELFAAMQKGGDVAFQNIPWFNGGLFDNDATLPLLADELDILLAACDLEWDEIDPSIFGTLFERGLDPKKRSQLGAHYTDPNTIMRIVEPVIVEPWRKAWEAKKAEIAALMDKADLFGPTAKTSSEKAARTKAENEAKKLLVAFLHELQAFTVLDPACGSGNFLFLALRALKDIEHSIIIDTEAMGMGRHFPAVGPENVKGIELNEYAAELARITIWIGEIQWMIQKGYGANQNPILRPLQQIENRDALVNDAGIQASWPTADVIIGNPPFIGGRKMRGELGAEYSDAVKALYSPSVAKSADFVCYWFEKARRAIEAGHTTKAGLVATNSITGGVNRKVLDAILKDVPIFEAWRDEPWVNEGAAVNVSIVCFGKSDLPVRLDGIAVNRITSSLTPYIDHDVADAVPLKTNANVSFQGVTPRAEIQAKRKKALGLPDADFTVEGDKARKILQAPNTVNGDPMTDVLRPYWIADDITGRTLDRYLVNFGTRSEEEAAYYEEPFKAIENVRLHRAQMDDAKGYPWWQLWRWRPAMLQMLAGLPRYIAIPRVSKHHVCAWAHPSIVPGDALVVVARDDDIMLGILQSKIHETWALRMGTSLQDRPRYTPKSSFMTFPFPEGLGPEVSASSLVGNPKAERIAQAAKKLVDAREKWINQPELVDHIPDVIPTYRPRIVPKPGAEKDLNKRTMTHLYNAPPPWLPIAHKSLDEAVADAYGWEWPLERDEILKRLYHLNQKRAK